MQSKARIAGHPLHPMVVVFPIAFYTATVATILAYVGTREAFWYRVGMVANLAGIVMAVIAIVPGAIDLYALPRGSRARTAGLQHAGFNLIATVLFAVTAFLLYRGWAERVMTDGEYVFDATLPLAMSVVAWVSMVIAGSLGWTLVQTHHVGIQPARVRADLLTRASREPRALAHDPHATLPGYAPGALLALSAEAASELAIGGVSPAALDGRLRARPGVSSARPMQH